MPKTARGFTLIELVVVITILGILAAFAVPRFLSLDRQARIASLTALQGSVRSASALAHSMWLANSGAAFTMDGAAGNINMVFGYPSRTAAGIPRTLQDTTGFTYTAATGTFSRNGAPTPATCSFTYTPPTALGQAPLISVINPNGC